MHSDACFSKFGACDLDCLESFCSSFTRARALDQFAFAQVSTWTEYLLSDCFYWTDLFVFSLAKKCEGTTMAALFMCGHFCYFIMSGWLCHRGAQSCHHDFLHQPGNCWLGSI